MNTEQRYKDDLHWALHSEPLIAADGSTWPDSSWFRALAPGMAPDSRMPVPRRLGLWFEQLIQNWLLQDAGRQLLAHNLQVRNDNRTLGEFDMLVSSAGHVEHWELAVKFYLGTSDLADAGNWFGPNPEDTLAGKIDRLTNHQLLLSATPEGKELLQQMNIDDIEPRGFVKGRLFYPVKAFLAGSFTFPGAVNPHHERGWWMSLSDFQRREMFDPNCRYLLLEKSHWLAPFTVSHGAHTTSRVTLLDQIDQLSGHGTWHIAVLDSQGNEHSRGFLVSTGWLESTRQEPERTS